jgi:predicted RNA-binding Zn ribbon-like protein
MVIFEFVPLTFVQSINKVCSNPHQCGSLSSAKTFILNYAIYSKSQPGVRMVDRPPEIPFQIALALEFLNTYAQYPQAQMDFLDTGEALVSWMLLAKIIDGPAAERILEETETDVLDDIAGEARSLREWFREFVVKRDGDWLASEVFAESARLNVYLNAGETFNTIVAGDDASGRPLHLRTIRRLRTARGLLALIAELLARYLCEGYLVRVSSCAHPGCGLMFADFSRDRRQRWCGATGCARLAWQNLRIFPGSEGDLD